MTHPTPSTVRALSTSGRSVVSAAAWLAACLVWCVGLVAIVWAQPDSDANAPRVQVRLEPEGPIGVDEAVRLVVDVSSSVGVDVRAPTFQLDNLEILNGPSQSHRVQFVNGVSSQSVGFTWLVRARKLGEARVYGGQVAVMGERFDLPVVTARVVADPPQRQRARPGSVDPFRDSIFGRDPFDRFQDRRRAPEPPPVNVFLEAKVEPAKPRVGQQAIYTLYLYTNVNVRSVTPTDMPEFKGFWARPIPQPDNVEPEMVERGGERLGRIVLLQRVLFPRRAGELEIGPVEAAMDAYVPTRTGFGSLLPRPTTLSRRSRALTVEVLPLPEPAPPGFDGTVGELTLKADLEPRELELGEAATLTLTLDGRGHLQGVAAPELTTGETLEVFPPQQQSSEELRDQLFYSTRTWSYVVVPRQVGAVELPPVKVTYFDPRRGEYRVAETEPMHLAVRGATSARGDAGQTVELHPIRSATLPATPGSGVGTWPVQRHALFALPLILGLALMTLRRTGALPGFGRAAARHALLDALDGSADQENPRQLASAIEDAWRVFLEARWQVPQGTTSNQWSRLLVEHGASRAAAEELVALADDLHYLRYAPKLASTEEMRRELVERSRRLARRLG